MNLIYYEYLVSSKLSNKVQDNFIERIIFQCNKTIKEKLPSIPHTNFFVIASAESGLKMN